MNSFIQNLIEAAATDNIKKLSVGAAVLHEGKLLILKRRPNDFMPNIYELPGGALELGESLLDALERELKEETGCAIDIIIGYLGHIDFPSSSGLLTRRFNFLIKPRLPVLVRLSEHDEHAWILPTEADNYEITTKTRAMINLVRDGIITAFK